MIRALAAFAFALFAILAPSTAYSQSTTSSTTSWEKSFPKHVAEELSNSDADRRTIAMVQVIHYGRFGDGTISWTPVVEPLLAIFENDPDEQARRVAVAALHATEDARAMSGLRSLAYKETSPRVIRSVVAALVEYYGLESFAGDLYMARLAERGRPSSSLRPATAQVDPSEKP